MVRLITVGDGGRSTSSDFMTNPIKNGPTNQTGNANITLDSVVLTSGTLTELINNCVVYHGKNLITFLWYKNVLCFFIVVLS